MLLGPLPPNFLRADGPTDTVDADYQAALALQQQLSGATVSFCHINYLHYNFMTVKLLCVCTEINVFLFFCPQVRPNFGPRRRRRIPSPACAFTFSELPHMHDINAIYSLL